MKTTYIYIYRERERERERERAYIYIYIYIKRWVQVTLGVTLQELHLFWTIDLY